MYYVRPTMGHWAVFVPTDMYHANKVFEGTREDCYRWVSEQMNKEDEK